MSPDGWVRAYFLHMQQLAAPGVSWVAGSWRVCGSCGYGRSEHLRYRGVLQETQVCAKCGVTWEPVVEWEPRGLFDRPFRPQQAEQRFYPWLDVGCILAQLYRNPRSRWPMRVYLVRVLGNHSLREIAAEGARRWPRARNPVRSGRRYGRLAWNRSRVAELIDEGRSLFAAKLAQVGLAQSGPGAGVGLPARALPGGRSGDLIGLLGLRSRGQKAISVTNWPTCPPADAVSGKTQ
jgi:hypothetical protein